MKISTGDFWIASKKKYVVAFALPMPEIHYRFYVKDAGN